MIRGLKMTSENINQIIEDMIAEKTNTKPFDFLFRRTSESYPKSTHAALNLPGIFKRIETPNIYTINGKALQQDIVISAMPDGKHLHHDTIFDLEHMSYLLTPDKIEVLYHSKNSTIKKYDQPCILYLITNIDYKTDELICKINNEVFSIKIIYFNHQKITEIINTISKKDYSKQEISEVDFIKLVYCLIFANKSKAKNVIEKIIDIFTSIKKIKFQHRLDLHLALKTMIKYHYNDKNEQRRLLTMITKTMTDEELERLPTIEYALEEKIPALEKTITEQEKIIAELQETITNKNKEISMLKTQNAK